MNCTPGTETDDYRSKDPDADLDYEVDWGANWLKDGDTIATSVWIVPDGIEGHDQTHDATTATIWLRAGTVGTLYKVVNRITTVQQRKNDKTLFIEVQEK